MTKAQPFHRPIPHGPVCSSCVDGDHECVGTHPGTGVKCACGCNIEPWPFEHADAEPTTPKCARCAGEGIIGQVWQQETTEGGMWFDVICPDCNGSST